VQQNIRRTAIAPPVLHLIEPFRNIILGGIATFQCRSL
jgi:hypothetical protein